MGVAVSVRVSTFTLSDFILSFTPTPNFCSSSMINRPKSLNITDLLTSLWVPMSMSISPVANFLTVSLCCAALRNLLI